MTIVNTVLYLTICIATDRPGPPEAPVETVETTSSIIVIKWNPPRDDGGSPVTNYIIERQQAGQSLWKKLGNVSADKTSFRDRNVTHGKKYNYRIYAENPEGLSDFLETNDSIMAGVMSEYQGKHPNLILIVTVDLRESYTHTHIICLNILLLPYINFYHAMRYWLQTLFIIYCSKNTSIHA